MEIPFILEKALWDCHHMEHNYIHTYVDYVTSLRKDTTGLFWQVSFQQNYENYKNYKITKIMSFLKSNESMKTVTNRIVAPINHDTLSLHAPDQDSVPNHIKNVNYSNLTFDRPKQNSKYKNSKS